MSLLAMQPAHATGMLPETSVVIVNEADGEASMNIKNTDATPALLYTSIQNLPEDPEMLVVALPQVARVEAGQTQLVRFVLQLEQPLKVQRLKRVIFEGIPPRSEDGGVKVSMNVRQNLPLIIHPKDLPLNREPWKLLKWSIDRNQGLVVHNDSAYIIRLAQAVTLLPGQIDADLGRTYVLPGEKLSARLKDGAGSANSVRFAPATVYAFTVEHFDAPLQRP